jgi:hypothetical protein
MSRGLSTSQVPDAGRCAGASRHLEDNNTPRDRRRAALVVASQAKNAEDRDRLLAMLGLSADELEATT